MPAINNLCMHITYNQEAIYNALIQLYHIFVNEKWYRRLLSYFYASSTCVKKDMKIQAK